MMTTIMDRALARDPGARVFFFVDGLQALELFRDHGDWWRIEWFMAQVLHAKGWAAVILGNPVLAAMFDRFLLRVLSENLDSYHFHELLARGVANEIRHMKQVSTGTSDGIRPVVSARQAVKIDKSVPLESACRLISAPAVNITLSKGLGTRHWAAAAITKNTNAIAMCQPKRLARRFEKKSHCHNESACRWMSSSQQP